MWGLKASQMHERPFKVPKEPMQPLAAQDSFLPYDKKIWFLGGLSSMRQSWMTSDGCWVLPIDHGNKSALGRPNSSRTMEEYSDYSFPALQLMQMTQCTIRPRYIGNECVTTYYVTAHMNTTIWRHTTSRLRSG